MSMQDNKQIKIAHIIFRLHVGGLENGLVNLINRLPENRFKHAIICIDTFTSFKQRIHNKNVQIFAINKRPGWDGGAIVRLFRLIRSLRPDIVHTRNLAALDALLPSLFAGVRRRIHGEHGRDVHDLDGTNLKFRMLRMLHRPLVNQYIALSQELEDYLSEKIGVHQSRISRIYNGVDTNIFHPSAGAGDRCAEMDQRFGGPKIIVGTVGRLDAVKDQANLVNAFQALVGQQAGMREKVGLAIVGDGPMMNSIESHLNKSALKELTWLPGSRDDIPAILRSFDLFVLPSLAEGISNTVLEAMASGLPVVATNVGGNSELVVEKVTGQLVRAADPHALCAAIATYVDDEYRRHTHGMAGRDRILRSFSIDRMVEQYRLVYEQE